MFHRCKTAKEAQALYLTLALRFDPAREDGGSFQLFALAQEAYELFLKSIDEEKPESKREFLLPGKYQFTEEKVSADDEDKCTIFDEIFEYSKTNKKFNAKFYSSVCKQLNECNEITAKQYNALVKIYYQFDMQNKKEEKTADEWWKK